MSEQAARMVILGVACAGAVVWLVSILRSMRIARAAEQRHISPVERIEIEGDPGRVSRAVVEALSGGAGSMMAPLRIEEADEKHVRFRMGSDLGMLPLSREWSGEFRIADVGAGKVRVTLHTNGAAARRGARVAMILACAIGLPVLVGVPLLLWLVVASSPLEAARWQAVQVIHVGHALWPPFLVMWMGARTEKMLADSLGRVLDRLRFSGCSSDGQGHPSP